MTPDGGSKDQRLSGAHQDTLAVKRAQLQSVTARGHPPHQGQSRKDIHQAGVHPSQRGPCQVRSSKG